MDNNLVQNHSGWEEYYSTQIGKRAWNGTPDEYLSENIEYILERKPQAILDVAAGDGRNSEPFLNRGISVVATDLSPSGLNNFSARCKTEKLQQPILVYGDFLKLGFASKQFDCVVCFNSVPHFEYPSECLANMARLLKPGGLALFNAFTPGDVAWGQGEQIGAKSFSYKNTLFNFMTEDDVKAIMPVDFDILNSETRTWEEPDHGTYRTGTHTHEACFFTVENRHL